ncbi:acyltransferase family protein [Aquibium oceanicum]|uniref:Acyltransferase n=1 Tax=Aquibium oceanicum TaxID=1670800 RepID=A0A1L3SQ25_9HYPH|nr:acyltransferase family protein [Aquibium oceanicum]APH71470.1 hypothetical protein BSQ44_08875 [Aquibium oceanicum]
MNYRPDIDGLRTVSVVSVILYHYAIGPFSGGFTGVDVFFVISGFLITSIIAREMEEGRFSVLGFYDRRVRRILPATLTTIIAAAIAGYIVLLPEEYSQFGESATYSAFGLANFFFLHNTGGYFDNAADLMPLLHMWSLAVEEQFYIVWPILLFVVLRFSTRSAAIAALIAIIAGSFVASVYIVKSDQPVAFYMLHTRAWELAIGALLVFVPAIRHRPAAEAIAVIGIGLVAYGIFALTAKSPFPGANALYPCVGAALLIGANAQRTVVARVLSLPPMVFVGKISFSLYLWHWPVLVLYRQYGMGDVPPLYDRLALIAVSFVLAALSWWLVEEPIRRRRPPRWVAVSVGGASMAAVATGCYALVIFGGLPSRLPADAREMASFMNYGLHKERDLACFVTSISDRKRVTFDPDRCLARVADKPNVLVLGDSHADHFMPALRQLYPGIHFAQAAASACQPVVRSVGKKRCTELMNDVFKTYLPNMAFDAVIISARWDRRGIKNLRKTIETVSRYTPEVIVFGPTVEYRHSLAKLLAKSRMTGQDLMRASRRYATKQRVDRGVAKQVAGTSAHLISILDAICPKGKCQVLTPDGIPIQWDYGHFTAAGATYVLQGIDLPLPSTRSEPKEAAVARRPRD